MKRLIFLGMAATCAALPLAGQNGTDDKRTLSADSLITSNGRLDSLYRSLPEVLVRGERPVVKVEADKLIYDFSGLLARRTVDNAYEALKELPGVVEISGALTLGGQPVTVMLDGKVATLTIAQLYALLKSLPPGRLDRAEVMYNAPARYQVRGALINLRLKQPDAESSPFLQGEFYAVCEQQHEANFEERVGLVCGRKRFSTDFLYSHKHGRSFSTTEKEALHSLNDGTVHAFSTREWSRSRSHTHMVRWGGDYTWAPDHRLSLVYNGNFSAGHDNSATEGTQRSDVKSEHSDKLHNVRLDYVAPFGLKGGAEFTYYHSPLDQWLYSKMNGVELNFKSQNSQRINRWKFFVSQEHELKKQWGVNYGAVYTTSVDNSYQYYNPVDATSPQLPDDLLSRRREETLNLYAGLRKSLGTKLSFDFSLAAEHYQTPTWNRWDCYPVLNVSYRSGDSHIWQFNLNSDKRYPDYWAVHDATSYSGGRYSEIQGNPDLRPARSYKLGVIYVWRSKYVFRGWFNYTDDYAVQTLYQSPQRLVEIYRYLNFDFQQQAGLQGSLPLKWGKWGDTRLTLIGVWMREKASQFYDLPFDRNIAYGMAVLSNSFTLSSKPDLMLTVGGMIHSKAIQGIYDLPASGNLDLSLRYRFLRKQATLRIYCNDVFETGGISPRIRYATQNVTNRYSKFREAGLSFSYAFGGYKAKEREEVDTSRFK